MNSYCRARVNYCTHLGKNVVFACRSDMQNVWECLNRFDCDYADSGCKNTLMYKNDDYKDFGTNINVANVEIEQIYIDRE